MKFKCVLPLFFVAFSAFAETAPYDAVNEPVVLSSESDAATISPDPSSLFNDWKLIPPPTLDANREPQPSMPCHQRCVYLVHFSFVPREPLVSLLSLLPPSASQGSLMPPSKASHPKSSRTSLKSKQANHVMVADSTKQLAVAQSLFNSSGTLQLDRGEGFIESLTTYPYVEAVSRSDVATPNPLPQADGPHGSYAFGLTPQSKTASKTYHPGSPFGLYRVSTARQYGVVIGYLQEGFRIHLSFLKPYISDSLDPVDPDGEFMPASADFNHLFVTVDTAELVKMGHLSGGPDYRKHHVPDLDLPEFKTTRITKSFSVDDQTGVQSFVVPLNYGQTEGELRLVLESFLDSSPKAVILPSLLRHFSGF